MKAVILAGGFGTRISEESSVRPKPMIEIGGRPILWHILKTYSAYGFNDFVICCGYKGYMIKEYFINYLRHVSDLTVRLDSGDIQIHQRNAEPWVVTLVDTGEKTLTGGRLKRVGPYLKNEECFFFTYGDGLANIDFRQQLIFHRGHGKLATITAVQPPGRYGALQTDGHFVRGFVEKPPGDGGFINGGFFVLSPKVLDYVVDDFSSWEGDPISDLAARGELVAYRHKGFWQAMDTLRDKNYLEELWSTGSAPWRCWSD
jgi:glucose-1-phosphate cytidylyltransferase